MSRKGNGEGILLEPGRMGRADARGWANSERQDWVVGRGQSWREAGSTCSSREGREKKGRKGVRAKVSSISQICPGSLQANLLSGCTSLNSF